MSPICKLVKIPAKSLGFSKIGPEVITILAPTSLATIAANVVFPSPGGPLKRA